MLSFQKGISRMYCRHLVSIIILSVAVWVGGCAREATSYVRPDYQQMQSLKTLAVTVKGNPEFTHTGKMNAESCGMIFMTGLAGAIVDTVNRGGLDKEEAQAIKPDEVLARARQDFTHTLVGTIRQSQRFETVHCIDDAADLRQFDAVLTVTITTWGSRIKDSQSNIVIPFMNVDVSMKTQNSQKLIWKETKTITYDTNRTMHDYTVQKELFGNDFKALIDKSGKQIAASLLKH